MVRDDDHWQAVADLFSAAPLDGDWPRALNAFADACGGRNGELIGIGGEAALFSFTTRHDPAAMVEWFAMGGYAPEINPRVRAGLGSPLFAAWHEVQCSTEEELRGNFEHADWCRRWDLPFGSQANVVVGEKLVVGLSVCRGIGAGVPQEEHRRAFESFMPAVRSAVLSQMAMEHQGAALVRGTLEAMDAAAFVCDRWGRVRALTPSAEAAIAAGPLRLVNGQLAALRVEDGKRLAAAIDGATQGAIGTTTVVVLGASPADVELLDIVSLPPQPYAFGFQPRAIVTIRKPARRDAALPSVLAAAYGLTRTEAEIAVALADGVERQAIADTRGISIQTLRTHIKRIFAKLGVNRESQLAARLQRLR